MNVRIWRQHDVTNAIKIPHVPTHLYCNRSMRRFTEEVFLLRSDRQVDFVLVDLMVNCAVSKWAAISVHLRKEISRDKQKTWIDRIWKENILFTRNVNLRPNRAENKSTPRGHFVVMKTRRWLTPFLHHLRYWTWTDLINSGSNRRHKSQNST